jgi:tungstate transport system ATP-binding protein
MAALVELQGASLHFGAVPALRGIDFSIHAGERIALVGSNGSGKTSLLRAIHGLAEGLLGKRRVADLGGRAPRLAMLFQRPFLLHLSARRNVAIGLWLHGVPREERRARVDEALASVGLQALARRGARTLSGGQMQRLALARAMALRPDLLLLDEPTASLDPGAKREVESLIETIADRGTTIVMSTHNLGQAKRLCSRVAYLEGGRLLVDLPISEFFDPLLPNAASSFLRGELAWA